MEQLVDNTTLLFQAASNFTKIEEGLGLACRIGHVDRSVLDPC